MLDYEDYFTPENDIIKAVYNDEDVYLDENGKHIVFRFIKGRIVPIHVDSSDYVDWLKDQGIPIDTASQEAMGQAEQILESLDRIREMAGPEQAAEYEKKLVQQYKDYFNQANNLGYQQVLQQRAAKQNTTPEDLHAKMKKTYEENKGNEISASKDREGEWASYIGDYTEKMLRNFPEQGVESTGWGIAHAFDLALMLAMEQAKKGVPPTQISLEEILRNEIKTRDGAAKYFSKRYDPKTNTSDYNLAAVSLLDGLENLLHNVERDTSFGKGVEAAYDRLYVKMFNDFDKPNQRNLAPMAPNTIPEISGEVPDELPEAFTQEEGSRLYSMYKNSTGNKLGSAHKVMIHTLSRMWESVPEDRRTELYSQLADENKGLHKIHKLNFIRAFQDASAEMLDVNPDKSVEESIRSGLSVAQGGNIPEIARAMKEITVRMAQLDGYYAYTNNKGSGGNVREIGNYWNDSPILAGRAKSKGEGPNLMQFFATDEGTQNGVIPNSTLKIAHRGRAPKVTAEQQLESAIKNPGPDKSSELTVPDPSSTGSQTTQGAWEREGRMYVDKATGWKAEMVPKKNVSGLPVIQVQVHSPDGRVIQADDEVQAHQRNKDDVRDEVIGIARKVQAQNGQISPSQKAAAATPASQPQQNTPPAPRSTEGDVENGKLLNEVLRAVESLGLKPLKVKTNTYAVKAPTGSHTFTIDNTGSIVLHSRVEGRSESTTINSPEQIKNLLGTQQQYPPPEGGKSKVDEVMSGISEEDLATLKGALGSLESQGLKTRAYPSTKRVAVTNPQKPDGPKIFITNSGGALSLHLVQPDNSFRGFSLEELSEQGSKLL